MKKFTFMAVLVLSMVPLLSGFNKMFAQSPVLPVNIQNYIDKHFQGIKILQTEVDRELFGKEYTVWLHDQTILDFDKRGQIKEVANKSGIRLSLLAAPVKDYVNKNFPDATILKWSLEDHRRQSVELNNGLEVVFTEKGEFIKLDD